MGKEENSFEIFDETATTCSTITIENGTRDDEVLMLFARLVQHCCGDRFPKISTINDEGRLYCLAFNKLKLAEAINKMPFNEKRRELIRRLDDLYPGNACPEHPQMDDVIDGDELVDILTVSYSIFLK